MESKMFGVSFSISVMNFIRLASENSMIGKCSSLYGQSSSWIVHGEQEHRRCSLSIRISSRRSSRLSIASADLGPVPLRVAFRFLPLDTARFSLCLLFNLWSLHWSMLLRHILHTRQVMHGSSRRSSRRSGCAGVQSPMVAPVSEGGGSCTGTHCLVALLDDDAASRSGARSRASLNSGARSRASLGHHESQLASCHASHSSLVQVHFDVVVWVIINIVS